MAEKTSIERVARVLCKREGRDPDEVCIGEGAAIGRTWLGWHAFVTDAVVVIRAMKVPTEAMLDAGQCTRQHWRRMIEAALVEHPTISPLTSENEAGE